MAVDFDASSLSAANNTSPLTWTHTPVGTPRGVTVAVGLVVSAGAVSAVTYGGQALTQVLNVASPPAEDGRAQVWFLGSGIPTGAQTVSVTHNGSGNTVRASAVTVTAATDTEIGDSESLVGDVTNPQVILSTVAVSLKHGVLYSGADFAVTQAAFAGMTEIGFYDSGFRMLEHDRETAASSGSFTFGYTTSLSAVYSTALAAVAVQEATPAVPTAPSSLAASAVSQTQIDLTWTDNSSNETSFRIERSPNGSTGWASVGTNSANDFTFSNTGLTCGTQYFYRVFAVNGSGDSTASNTANATTSACPPAPPSTGGNRMGGTGAIRRPPRTVSR